MTPHPIPTDRTHPPTPFGREKLNRNASFNFINFAHPLAGPFAVEGRALGH